MHYCCFVLVFEMLLTSLFLLFCLLLKTNSQETNQNCREKYRPISTDNADMFELVDAIPSQNLTLECHYCLENDDGQPKNWYKTDKPGLEPAREVTPGMENEMELNRIRVNSDHSLSIYNVSENDMGLYYCKGFLEENVGGKFNYFVDLIEEYNTTEVESGNMTAWNKYHEEYLAPINVLLEKSEGPEFVEVRENLKVSMEVISHWNKWSACDVCGRPKGEAVKKKRGECTIKLRSHSIINRSLSPDEILFRTVNEISCKSVKLERIFPGISNLTKIVPDFVQLEKCDGTCNPDKDGENSGWKVGKSKGFKYRKTFVLQENSHLTLVCPESTLENRVMWQKRGRTLKPGDASYPHMYVDTFNTLYLDKVTKEEEGNYSCQVDDIKMQRVFVHVVSHSKFFTGELARHMGYLGFILILTIPCYCAGLVVTWWRRKTFQSYEELLKENPDDDDIDEESAVNLL